MATPLDREFEARPGGCQRPSIHSSSSMNRPLQLHLAAFSFSAFGGEELFCSCMKTKEKISSILKKLGGERGGGKSI